MRWELVSLLLPRPGLWLEAPRSLQLTPCYLGPNRSGAVRFNPRQSFPNRPALPCPSPARVLGLFSLRCRGSTNPTPGILQNWRNFPQSAVWDYMSLGSVYGSLRWQDDI